MIMILSIGCQSAFKQFVQDFNKNYQTNEEKEIAYGNFCSNLKFIKSNPRFMRLNQFSDLKHPPVSGYIHPTLPEEIIKYSSPTVTDSSDLNQHNRKSKQIVEQICSAQVSQSINYISLSDNMMTDYLFSGENLPLAIDLRKDGLIMRSIDQGTCGSCWAQSTRFVMHSLFIHDLPYYKEIYKHTSIDNLTNKNLIFSVQYMMNNSYGRNLYCNGGNFQYLAQDIANFKVSSLNYDSDAPYVSIFEPDTAPPIETPKTAKQDPSDFNHQQRLNPVYWQNDDNGDFGCPQSLFKIELTKKDGGQNLENVKILKGFLARGIAVAGRQFVPSEGPSAIKYSQYKGGVLDESNYKCVEFNSNHQVTFVGYGTVKGTEVWVMMNSWGAQWGVSGSFYVAIGSNALCSEIDAFAVLPRFINYKPKQEGKVYEDLSVPYNKSKLYEIGKDKYIFDTFPEVHWGMNGLDSVDEAGNPSFVPEKISLYVWVMAGIVAVFSIMIIALITKCIFSPPYKKLKIAKYSQVSGNEAEIINWSQGVQ